MKSKVSRWWKIYFIIFTTISTSHFLKILSPYSNAYIYNHLLAAFYQQLVLFHYFTACGALLNLLTAIPLLLFIYQKSLCPRYVWQGFLFLRIISDIYGHNYDMQFMSALFYTDVLTAILLIIFTLILIIPAYIVCFKFAFKNPHPQT